MGAGDEDAESGAGDSSESWLREVARVEDVDVVSQLGASAHLQQLGRFRITGRLGSGGMGVVYRAVDEQLHREVALKVLPASIATDGERRRRLLREARAAAAVTHPNIATVYEAGEVEGRVFVAMELVEGETLRARIERGPLAIEDALKIARQLLTALARAHDKGLVHRDLKPENVMIDGDGNVKVLDFGLAKIQEHVDSVAPMTTPSLAETALSPTDERRVIGTPGYMAPEQTRSPAVDARADLFSFGVMLYEMVAGVRPFTGATAFDVMMAIARDQPISLEAHRASTPANMVAVVERCLRKEPEDRYANANEVLKALERRDSSVDSARTTPANKSARRSLMRRPWSFAGALALLAAAGAAVVGSSRLRTVAPLADAEPHPRPAPPPSSTATTYMNLPSSPTTSDSARTALAEGLLALRDGDSGKAETDFEQAIVADPAFASAQLQLCVIHFGRADALAPAERAQCFDTLLRKGGLLQRDAELLEVISPTFGDPADYAEAQRRAEAFTKRRPEDAEGWDVLGITDVKLDLREAAVAAFDQETRVDPDATVVVREQMLEGMGETDKAAGHLRACVSRHPLDVACRMDLAFMMRSHGACTDMERLGREITAIAPDRAWGYFVRAEAAAGLDEPREAIEELKAQNLARQNSTWRRIRAVQFAVRSAVATGDLALALQQVDSWARIDGASPSELAAATVIRGDLLTEIGDRSAAGEAASSFLRRARAFPIIGVPEDDETGILLGFELQAGSISREQFTRRVNDWLADWRSRRSSESLLGSGPGMWLQSCPVEMMSTVEAQQALDALPTFGTFPPPGNSSTFTSEGRFGEVLRRAGRTDEAIVRLEAATHACSDSRWPRDFFHLGQAYETKGDTPAACRAYSAVLRFWGHAKPRSVTADAARARFAKLACEP